jgi:ribonuclease-3 family protein
MKLSIAYEVQNPELVSPLALAYVGDAVLEVYIRNYLVSEGGYKTKELHKRAVSFVNAATQANLLRSIETSLSEEELGIAKRGRNAKSGHVPKNQSMIDYRYSTGFECLLGYLYLLGREERMKEVIEELIKSVDGGEKE